ncbi:hypothetical protein J6590_008809 [Homalodisca vitripennis]|nr:hypothetical protein J6590_008809 [Homalodisca vitripennis]
MRRYPRPRPVSGAFGHNKSYVTELEIQSPLCGESISRDLQLRRIKIRNKGKGLSGCKPLNLEPDRGASTGAKHTASTHALESSPVFRLVLVYHGGLSNGQLHRCNLSWLFLAIKNSRPSVCPRDDYTQAPFELDLTFGTIAHAIPAGRRPLGRPKIRWCDQVVEDVTRCGGSVDLAEDRVAWKRLIDEAKNRLRFVTPRHYRSRYCLCMTYGARSDCVTPLDQSETGGSSLVIIALTGPEQNKSTDLIGHTTGLSPERHNLLEKARDESVALSSFPDLALCRAVTAGGANGALPLPGDRVWVATDLKANIIDELRCLKGAPIHKFNTLPYFWKTASVVSFYPDASERISESISSQCWQRRASVIATIVP